MTSAHRVPTKNKSNTGPLLLRNGSDGHTHTHVHIIMHGRSRKDRLTNTHTHTHTHMHKRFPPYAGS